jgi:hypothetical protein
MSLNKKPLFHPRLLKERLPKYQLPVDWQQNAAYQLTPEEVELLWKTAPPRMPNAKP